MSWGDTVWLGKAFSSSRDHFPTESGAASACHLFSCCSRSCPISIPSFPPPRAFHLGRSDMPVPDDPCLDTVLSHRQTGNVSSWQPSEHPQGCVMGCPCRPTWHSTSPDPCPQIPARGSLPAMIILCPRTCSQHSQPQSFMSLSLSGPIPLQFLRDFLTAPFPTPSLLGRGLGNV